MHINVKQAMRPKWPALRCLLATMPESSPILAPSPTLRSADTLCQAAHAYLDNYEQTENIAGTTTHSLCKRVTELGTMPRAG